MTGPVESSAPVAFDAIVLAGGRSRRLGQDKAGVRLDGDRLVDRAVSAAIGAGARRCVVVGPASLRPAVPIVQEDPPFGGPVAGIAAGLRALGPPSGEPRVLLMATDVADPGSALRHLLAVAEPTADGVHLTDPDGRAQWLVGHYRRAALVTGLAALGETTGASVASLVAGMTLREVPVAAGVARDIDTWDDLERAREALDGTGRRS